jgi:tripartite-type tricarboxylate transporter receptor subunit TctC
LTKTPREIVAPAPRIQSPRSTPDVREKIVKTGADPLSLTLPEFEAMIAAEFESNGKLIKAANIKGN